MGGGMKRVLVAVVVGLASLVAVAPASAGTSGVQHLHFKAGPYVIVPGANLILTQIGHVPNPTLDHYMGGFRPNLHSVAAGGRLGGIPRVDVIHLHHGVWLSSGAARHGEGLSTYGPVYPFAAAGEEN